MPLRFQEFVGLLYFVIIQVHLKLFSMISFFRKIRKSIIEIGGGRRYLLYAIGEIGLVVLGILIALQINTWNESRKDHLRLQAHYHELKNELLIDRINLDTILFAIREIDQKTLELYKITISDKPLADSKELIHAIIAAEPYAFFSISKSAYSNLVSSGDIHLVKNASLKNLLSIYHDNENWNWTAHNGNLKLAIERYAAYVHQFTHPLLFRNAYIHQFFPSDLADEPFELQVAFDSLPVDWERIRTDKTFSAILSQLMEYRVFQMYFYKTLIKDINEIVQLLDAEINNK